MIFLITRHRFDQLRMPQTELVGLEFLRLRMVNKYPTVIGIKKQILVYTSVPNIYARNALTVCLGYRTYTYLWPT